MITPINHPAGQRITLDGARSPTQRPSDPAPEHRSSAIHRLRLLTAPLVLLVAFLVTSGSNTTVAAVTAVTGALIMTAMMLVGNWSRSVGLLGIVAEIAVDTTAALFVAVLTVGGTADAAWLIVAVPIVEAAARLPGRVPIAVVAGIVGSTLALVEVVSFGRSDFDPDITAALVHLAILAAIGIVTMVLVSEARVESRLVVNAGLESDRRARILGAVAAAGCRLDSDDTASLVDVVVDLGHRLGSARVSAVEYEPSGEWSTVSPAGVPVMAVERAAGEAVRLTGTTVETTVGALDNVPSGHAADEVIVAVPVTDEIVVVVAAPELPGSLVVEAMEIVAEQAGFAIERARALAEAQAQREALVHRVGHDDMTGLVNRARFQELLAERARLDEYTALLYIDLDRFKEINDRFGHDTGDRLLVAVAKRLESVVRPGDVAARHGGDEFTILLGAVSSARDVEAVANRVIGALSQPFVFDGVICHIGASVGAAIAMESADVSLLIERADAAMYRAKRSGGDCVAIDHG